MFYGFYKGVEGLFFLKTGEKGDRKGIETGERWMKNTKNREVCKHRGIPRIPGLHLLCFEEDLQPKKTFLPGYSD